MNYTPTDILVYVLDNNKDADFMISISLHKQGYSIGEIPDVKFKWKNETLMMYSKAYNIKQPVNDIDIMIAEKSGKYISSFISRHENQYQIHFLVHECMTEEKSDFEDDIANRVVQYMILKTIKALRLDSIEKVDAYLS